MNIGKIVIITSLFIAPVFATADIAHKVIVACYNDSNKFCSDVQPGEDRVMVCLDQHSRELSRDCRKAIEEAKKIQKDFWTHCVQDIHRLCADVKAGHGRIRTCLDQHTRKLSYKCRKSLEKLPK